MYDIFVGVLIGFIMTTIIFNVIMEETKKSVSRETSLEYHNDSKGGFKKKKPALILHDIDTIMEHYQHDVAYFTDELFTRDSIRELMFSNDILVWASIKGYEIEFVHDERSLRLIVSRGTNE